MTRQDAKLAAASIIALLFMALMVALPFIAAHDERAMPCDELGGYGC